MQRSAPFLYSQKSVDLLRRGETPNGLFFYKPINRRKNMSQHNSEEDDAFFNYSEKLIVGNREEIDNPVSRFFLILDIYINAKMIKSVQKAQYSAIAKKGNENAQHSLLEIFHAASEHANVSSVKRIWTRFLVMLLPSIVIGSLIAWLVMGQDSHFLEQMNRHDYMIMFGGIVVIDAVLTALWKKISMPVLRFFVSFMCGGVITIVVAVILLAWYGGKPGAETTSFVSKILLGITGLFWLLWNFWPTTKKVKDSNDGGSADNSVDNESIDDILKDLNVSNGGASSDEDLEEMK